MALISDLPKAPVFGFVPAVFGGVRDFFDSVARASAAAAEYDALSDLSDRQLAERGMNRTTIGHHVVAKHLDV